MIENYYHNLFKYALRAVQFFRLAVSGELKVKFSDYENIKLDNQKIVHDAILPVENKILDLEKKTDSIFSKVSGMERCLETVENIDKNLAILVDKVQVDKVKELEKELVSTKAELEGKIEILKAELFDIKSRVDKNFGRGRSNSFS